MLKQKRELTTATSDCCLCRDGAPGRSKHAQRAPRGPGHHADGDDCALDTGPQADVQVAGRIARRIMPGIRVHGEGDHVTVPPSVHANGQRFEWLNGEPPPPLVLSPVPYWLLVMITHRPSGDMGVLARAVFDVAMDKQKQEAVGRGERLPNPELARRNDVLAGAKTSTAAERRKHRSRTRR